MITAILTLLIIGALASAVFLIGSASGAKAVMAAVVLILCVAGIAVVADKASSRNPTQEQSK